jgi:hypothetical protein
MRCRLAALLLLIGFAASAQDEVRFSGSSPLADAREIARRLCAPPALPVDLAQESFLLYVPPAMPEGGYGLLVFVPPWEGGTMPLGWTAVFDKQGMIYVAALKSGNAQKVLDRRVPLALLGAVNVMKHHQINPERVYVGGFSGGSRVAMHLALTYPDLFKGAILNAGSDPIGDADLPLPPADLMRRFQESSHLAYVTGEQDQVNVRKDMESIVSMRRWCQFSTWTLTIPWKGHEAATANALSRAIDYLDTRPPVDQAELAACREGLK